MDLGERFYMSISYLLAHFGFDTAEDESSKVCLIPCRRTPAGDRASRPPSRRSVDLRSEVRPSTAEATEPLARSGGEQVHRCCIFHIDFGGALPFTFSSEKALSGVYFSSE